MDRTLWKSGVPRKSAPYILRVSHLSFGQGDLIMSKRKRHDPEQILRKLQDADCLLNAGKSVEHVCQALEMSSAAYHRRRNQ